MTKKIIYLASPYGFSTQWRKNLLPEFISILGGLGAEIWEPFERNGTVDISRSGWAYNVAITNLQAVKDSDALFAIVNGNRPDEGVLVELDIAIALEKPIFFIS